MNCLISYNNISIKKINRIINEREIDILISTDVDLCDKIKKIYDIQVRHISINNYEREKSNIDITKQFTKKLEEQISELCSDFELVYPFINGLYTKNINLICNLITGVKKILKKFNIKKLYLIGGNDKVEYFSFSFSEGERPFNFLYKRNWFFNYYLYHVFKDQLNVNFIFKTSKYKLKLFRFFRTRLIKIIVFLLYTLEIIKNLFLKNNIASDSDSNKNIILLLVRTESQLKSLEPIYKKLKDKGNNPFFLYINNLTDGNITKKLNKKKYNYKSLFDFVNFKEYKNLIFDNIKKNYFINHKNEKLKVRFNTFKLFFNVKNVLNELSVYWFELILRYNLLNKISENSEDDINLVITTETIDRNAAIEGFWARQNNINIYTIQHVIMGSKLLPEPFWTDKIFFMSKKTHESFKKKYNYKKNNFFYIGPMIYDDYYNTGINNQNLNKVCVLTQPDDFMDDYIKILNDLISIREKMKGDFKIIIKLHPREKRVQRFKSIVSNTCNIKIIKNEINSLDIIKNVNLSISINSGTIMQSIIVGTPVLSVNYKNKYTEFNKRIDFISHKVTPVVSTKEEMKEFIQKYEKNKKEFIKNRSNFIKINLNNYSGNATNNLLKHI